LRFRSKTRLFQGGFFYLGTVRKGEWERGRIDRVETNSGGWVTSLREVFSPNPTSKACRCRVSRSRRSP
jgi:hypothetical protein